MRKYLLSFVCLCCVFTACNHSSEDECSSRDMAHCSSDGLSILYCKNGSWTKLATCDAQHVCGYMDGAVQCLQNEQAKCGSQVTCSNNVLQKCGEDGFWHYETCPVGTACENNACTPQPVEPVKEVYGIVKRQCSADKKSIELVDTLGKVTSRTCLSEVGFDTVCETFSNGHVGCVLPKTCTADFPSSGRCVDSLLMRCDERFISPKPVIDDCSAIGRVCAAVGGNAECREVCTTVGEYSCQTRNGLEYVSKCLEVGTQKVSQEALELCENESTSVKCSDEDVVRTTCGDGEKCLNSQNRCVEICTADDIGAIKCSKSGEVVECAKVEEGYAYVSRGRRHCDGDINIVCSKDEETGAVSEKRIDCTKSEMEDGSIQALKCVTNLMYYEDFDVCFEVEDGDPCGELDEAGICDGTVLKYCDTQFDHAISKDCTTDKDGFTNCSVYEGYAACWASCSKAGTANCSYNASIEAYGLTLCVPDEKTGKNIEIDGESICLGDVLYACDGKGKVVKTDCAVNGGRCDANACVYPACKGEEPTCLADDLMISCEVSSEGAILGSAMQTMTCRPDGNCQICKDGKVVTSE
ncbi:MAG: hypothetical protein IJU23_01345 [Proteobacteria bacterium]|nr:hypothetical protein [Pseudomonadota bacterium]